MSLKRGVRSSLKDLSPLFHSFITGEGFSRMTPQSDLVHEIGSVGREQS
jgi:hypothetical protein